MEKCPICSNKKLVEVGIEQYEYERSVTTGKTLKRSKFGAVIWWKYKCKCGWESEGFTQ